MKCSDYGVVGYIIEQLRNCFRGGPLNICQHLFIQAITTRPLKDGKDHLLLITMNDSKIDALYSQIRLNGVLR